MRIRPMKDVPHRSETGAALIVAVIFAAAIGIMAGSFLTITHNEYRLSSEAFLSYGAFNLAEAGTDEAIWAIIDDTWNGWTTSGTYASKGVNGFSLGDGHAGEISIIVENYLSKTPTLLIEGKAETIAGLDSVRQLRVTLDVGLPVFVNGLVAKEKLDLGGNANIDSYDPTFGGPDGTANRGDKANVGSLDVDDGDVEVGNSIVYGKIKTGGGDPTLGGSVSLSDSNSVVDPDLSLIATDFTGEYPVLQPRAFVGTPADDTDAQIVNLRSNGANETITGGTFEAPLEYDLASFEMGSNSKLTVAAGSYVKMVVSGDIIIEDIDVQTGANVEIWVNGNMTMSGTSHGGGDPNTNPSTESLVIYGTNASTVKTFTLNGGTQLSAAVYAPNVDITINGGGSPNNYGFLGAALGKNITINGSVNFHYDESLVNFMANTRKEVSLNSWQQLNSQSDRIDFASYSSP